VFESQLFILSVLRALLEVAGFALLGQGLLYVLAGASREQNVVYKLFCIVTRPVVRAVRAVTPRLIIDKHVPIVTFFLVFWLWLFLAIARRWLCQANGLVC
jgi:hypothetical protein